MSTPPLRLDLRGVPCPLTWARAKMFLEGLATGTVVEVVTDDERSARDLPAAAEAVGYGVVKTEPWGTAKAAVITIER
ncbi:MAG TPA: sulfurtransferase TusA family protein [Candidatus Binatia bacterium]|nr:sulfurtransferase TusA family protein [Candidatus Binatia bacterium]